MQKPFSVSQIRPNPFRHTERYPIQRDKVEALKQSLQKTGYWENIMGREVSGGVEIAYGHHRLVALQEEMGAEAMVSVTVKDLTDDKMLQIMAHENMEEWSSSASITMETVRAVVMAYAEGKIKLPPTGKHAGSGLRYAPSFVRASVQPDTHRVELTEKPYVPISVALFLGWDRTFKDKKGKIERRANQRVRIALNALELIEMGVVDNADFVGLGTDQAEAVVLEASREFRARNASVRIAQKARQKAVISEKRALREKEKGAQVSDKRLAMLSRNVQDADKQMAKALDEAISHARGSASAVAKKLKAKETTVKAAKDAARASGRTPRELPDINRFAQELATQIHGILRNDANSKKLEAVLKHRNDLLDDPKRILRDSLKSLARHVNGKAAKLQ